MAKHIYQLVFLFSFLFLSVSACSGKKQNDPPTAQEILKNTQVPDNWTVVFDKIEHDFDTIQEKNGPVSVVFTFVNRDTKPVALNQVRSSCGCTASEWSKEPVAPGNTGFIRVTYDPQNRPGRFSKTVKVGTTGTPESFTLMIKGNVLNGEYIPPKETISFLQQEHNFGKIKENGGLATYIFEFHNKGEEPIVISHVSSSCGCTTPEWSKEPVPPGETGFIKASYDPKNRVGSFNKTITVNSNGFPSSIGLRLKGEVER